MVFFVQRSSIFCASALYYNFQDGVCLSSRKNWTFISHFILFFKENTSKMSLVAYGDSDDGSSDSEGEENTDIPSKNSSFSAGECSTSTAQSEQETVPSTSTASQDISMTNSGKRSSLSSLLPKPNKLGNATAVIKSNFSSLNAQVLDDDEDEIVEVEEEYVPLSQIKKDKKTPVSETNEEQKSVGSLFSRMPAPWSVGAGISLGKKRESGDDEDDKSRKRKQPVRIVAPTINEVSTRKLLSTQAQWSIQKIGGAMLA